MLAASKARADLVPMSPAKFALVTDTATPADRVARSDGCRATALNAGFLGP